MVTIDSIEQLLTFEEETVGKKFALKLKLANFESLK